MSDESRTEMIRKIAMGEYTPEELSAFLKELDQLDEESYVRVFNAVYKEVATSRPGEIDPLFKARLEARLDSLQEQERNELSVVTMRPGRRWLRWTAAAALVLLIGGGTYLIRNRTNEKPTIAGVPDKQDVLPPSSVRATITLAGGQKVFLDSVDNGTLAVQGKVSVTKNTEGLIEYKGSVSSVPGSPVVYNTLSNPRGSKAVSMRLSDGTLVWLNSESSLTYPVAFTGTARKVAITGEAYFEVAKDAAMPFIVTKEDISINVLGTHFNVNAYMDETTVKVTLLEGSVKVTRGNVSDLLSPGKQAQIGKDIKVVAKVDADEVIAWKNGKFIFGDNTDINTIMRQVARWYDVDVEYQGAVTQHFWGSVSRSVNVSRLLRLLETTGGVHFKIEGRKVIVMP